jgi:tetratricopeptide (TPR) repeat protein
MKKYTSQIILLSTILLFILSSPDKIYSNQLGEQRKFQFASSYFENGEYEDAARLFSELHELRPKNDNYFFGLVASLRGLGNFQRLIPLLENYAKEKPSSKIYIMLAESQFSSGDEISAKESFSRAKNNATTIEDFLYVSESQSKQMLFVDALQTLKIGGEKLKDKTLFREKIIKYYIALGDYENACPEIILMLAQNRSLPMAEGKLYALMSNEKANKFIKEFLQKESAKQEKNILVQELLAWYLRTMDDYSSALELYKRIDKIHGDTGRELLKFADITRKDKKWDISLEAYEFIIDNTKYKKYLNKALLSYAKTIEGQAKSGKIISKEKTLEIISRYEEYIAKFPTTIQSAEARLRVALLQKNKLSQMTKAEISFKELIQKFPKYRPSARAWLELSDIYLSRGETKKARSALINLSQTFKKKKYPELELVKLKLSKLVYFDGDIDSARTLYSNLAKSSNKDIANDALEMSLHLNADKDFPGALEYFSKAEYSLILSDSTGARTIFNNIIEFYPKSYSAQLSYFRLAEILASQNKITKSIDLLVQFHFEYAGSIFGDKCLFVLGSYLEEDGQTEKAIESYTEILLDHPNSIYLTNARKKIRHLRENIEAP